MVTQSNSSGKFFSRKLSFQICIRYSYTSIFSQAALGPVALDLAKKSGDEDFILWAQEVLTIVVLSILLTAPVGAIGITLGGPRLLPKDSLPAKDVNNGNSEVVVIGSVNDAFSH